MSFLDDLNCATVLEAIKKEKERIKNELDSKSDDYIEVSPNEGAFWTDLFANFFLCSEKTNKNNIAHDDMLFFVSRIDSENSKIEVYRKDSKKLPCLTDFNYDWEETVYLNLILHEFEYTLTCAICIQTKAKELQILKRHSKRVYASPSKRDLQSKGEEELITYPNLYFMVDDFDEAFNEMVVKENEMVCVELSAKYDCCHKVLFLGSIKYDALKKVYDARASTGAKIVQKMTMGKINEKRVEFVKMKGPGGKGYAEMAVSQFKKKNDELKSQTFTSMDEKNFQEMFTKPLSMFGKALGQAYTIFKSPNNQSSANLNETDEETTHFDQNHISLNAYLTYVNLKINLIMQDMLETRQKTILFG
ncbi:hypothetical protein BpHYR1_027479 [Brachionus plicatilis]|uniref:Uncharacterized protein n=1 Tax=Brachionus plicatilis TaxID=10195 RepID=A0A3M7RYR3_BRAPC|nr:hypothetical protein BpHYR1_027479 [Brachionus plicatilis]